MSPSTRLAFVDGIALWGSRLPGWPRARAILAGREPAPDRAEPRPSPELLPANERRRAPDSVAIALHAAQSACQQAQRDPASLRSVFTSMHGDLAITDYMCSTLASDPSLVSPTRFHNSVHNAAAGYWSIGTASPRPYTSLSAAERSFAVGLFESLVQLAATREDVLLVAYDIEARGPLATVAPSQGLLAAALVLAAQAGPGTQARCEWRLLPAGGTPISQPSPGHAALVAGNSNAPCLPLFEALAVGAESTVTLEVSPEQLLELRLTAVTA